MQDRPAPVRGYLEPVQLPRMRQPDRKAHSLVVSDRGLEEAAIRRESQSRSSEGRIEHM